jgi:hypothetical protein
MVRHAPHTSTKVPAAPSMAAACTRLVCVKTTSADQWPLHRIQRRPGHSPAPRNAERPEDFPGRKRKPSALFAMEIACNPDGCTACNVSATRRNAQRRAQVCCADSSGITGEDASLKDRICYDPPLLRPRHRRGDERDGRRWGSVEGREGTAWRSAVSEEPTAGAKSLREQSARARQLQD